MASKKKNTTNGKAKSCNFNSGQSPQEDSQGVKTGQKVNAAIEQQMETASKPSNFDTTLKVSNSDNFRP